MYRSKSKLINTSLYIHTHLQSIKEISVFTEYFIVTFKKGTVVRHVLKQEFKPSKEKDKSM